MNESWISMLLQEGAVFDEGRLVHFGDAAAECKASATTTMVCDLSHEGLLKVSGADAATFLQGQLSNDVLALDDHKAHWNSWNTPKGRMLVSLLIWKTGDDFLLQMPRALLPAVHKRLQMFVLRSKVVIEDHSPQRIIFGMADRDANRLNATIHAVFGVDAPTVMQKVETAGGWLVRLSPHRVEAVLNASEAVQRWQALGSFARPAGSACWDNFAIRDGLVQILPATQDHFVPQMVNFDLIGGVSFSKGCYPGQEIVARTQYRGILKRRMVWVTGQHQPMPQPGESVYATEFGDQAAGTFANVAPSPEGGFDALVVAQIESIKANSLRAGAVDGTPLAIVALPYDLGLT